MSLTRADYYAIVSEFIAKPNLVNHMLSVEAAMRSYARMYGEDEDLWGAVGLLHDFDWEIHPALDKHPMDGAPILRERGVDEEIIRSIQSHAAEATGVPRAKKMDHALYACDELTGLITAVALVRPSKDIRDVKLKSVKKKWKDRSFAPGAVREDIEQGAEELGVELWAHVQTVLEAMQSIASELGLDGSLAQD